MNYRIVQLTDEGWITSDVSPENLAAWCEIRGYKVVRVNNNPRHRAELQGQPIISGLCGPMWDGDRVRYEDGRANRSLSA